MPLTEEESSSFIGDFLAKLRQIAEGRAESHMRDSGQYSRKGPTRRDVGTRSADWKYVQGLLIRKIYFFIFELL